MSSQTRLFVGNLPKEANENGLREAFSFYGDVTNVDLKSKPSAENNAKKFAFITLSAPLNQIESCIQKFTTEDFQGSRLYVTRARESFLERLQRERQEIQLKEITKNDVPKIPKKNPVIKLGDKLNPRKRKFDEQPKTNGFVNIDNDPVHAPEPLNGSIKKHSKLEEYHKSKGINKVSKAKEVKRKYISEPITEVEKKKIDSDKKRLESMQKKRQEFKQKQMIIKTGLVGIDKVPNKKTVFSDDESDTAENKNTHPEHKLNNIQKQNKGNALFEDDESDDEVNFEIKEQYEGKKGQKVLELQSRYKSDKRFTLDERFIDDGESDKEKEEPKQEEENQIDLGQADEKAKQMNILQNVLGIAIKSSVSETDLTRKKVKSKLGMLRFDPSQPEHAKFLAPIEETKQELSKKSKKTKTKEKMEVDPPAKHEMDKVEVSKEQFYKITDTLKEAIVQPNTFSLRSLFNRDQEDDAAKEDSQETSYIPLEKPKEQKVRNPLDKGEINPFKYDSSDSEAEETEEPVNKPDMSEKTEIKAVWKENLFFSSADARIDEGLAFFNNHSSNKKMQKERRELKSVMKKRLQNKERKDQMFRKKIGGRRKSVKKSFRMKS